jgi:hypothetical protein
MKELAIWFGKMMALNFKQKFLNVCKCSHLNFWFVTFFPATENIDLEI